MSLFGQLFVNGLIAGSIYALVSCGFALIYNTNKFMHFAHGSIVVISGYIIFTLYSILGLNFFYAAVSTVIYAGFLGFMINRLVYVPLQKRKASGVILLIASVSVLILFQNVMQIIFGPEVKDLNYIEIKEGYVFLGANVTSLQIVIMIFSVFLFFCLYYFMKKTRVGKNMRAVSDNKELANIVGIDNQKISDLSFMIGSAIAGLAGVLIALEQNVSPTMGTNLIIKGFSGAVIGGISSIPASILGAYLVGIAENLGIYFIPSGFKEAVSFLLLFLFLLFKPEGLIGIKRRKG